MCQFRAFYHCLCEHIDYQVLFECSEAQYRQASGNDSQVIADSATASTHPGLPGPFCVPCMPVPESGLPGNVIQWNSVQAFEVSPIVLAQKSRLEEFRQRTQAAVYGQAGASGQPGLYDQAGLYGEAVYQDSTGQGAALQTVQQPHDQYEPYDQSFDTSSESEPPIVGLCASCTAAVEHVRFIHRTEPNYGLTEDEVMNEKVWRFVVEAQRRAWETVNTWLESLNSGNPPPRRVDSGNNSGFLAHLPLPPWPNPPDSSMQMMVNELIKEIIMQKMNEMIITNNDEVEAIRNTYRPYGAAFYANCPHRFVSHEPIKDVFADEGHQDEPQRVPPLFQDSANGDRSIKKKYKVSWMVEGKIRRRIASRPRSPTPASRSPHAPSLLDEHVESAMDVDDVDDVGDGNALDHFTLTDTSVDSSEEEEDDDQTMAFPGLAMDDRSDYISTPGMTTDTGTNRSSNTAFSTPTTPGRSRKRMRIQPPLPERWRSALRPRTHIRNETMGGLYLD